jgi:hypothetical protein
MKTEPIESLTNKIVKEYNKQPLGWTVLTDFMGNMLVLGPKEGYMLKMVPLNPQEQMGVGARIDSLREMKRVVEGAPSYGFRPLSRTQSKKLLDGLHHTERQQRIVSEILKSNPIPLPNLEESRPDAVLTGPVLAHPDLSAISESQRELESKLAVEAEKLFRKRYPHRAAIYG